MPRLPITGLNSARLARIVLALVLASAAWIAQPAAAQTAAPAATTADAAPAKTKKPPSEKQLAAREHMKACGAEWRDMKAKGTAKDTTWRAFSKSCLSKKA